MRTKRESDGREGGREEGGKEGKKKKMVEYLEKLANLLYLLNGQLYRHQRREAHVSGGQPRSTPGRLWSVRLGAETGHPG